MNTEVDERNRAWDVTSARYQPQAFEAGKHNVFTPGLACAVRREQPSELTVIREWQYTDVPIEPFLKRLRVNEETMQGRRGCSPAS